MKDDLISIEDLQVQCIIGENPEERLHVQTVFISICVGTDIRAAAESDDLKLSIDYTKMAECAKEVAIKGKFLLIETMAERIAQMLLNRFGEKITTVRLKLKKPEALPDASATCVCIERSKPDLTPRKNT
jgi:dihydroneopterin aldolase